VDILYTENEERSFIYIFCLVR